jgi:branched-chain amino acid transport system ATP-binding protein
MESKETPILSLQNLTKHFGGLTAIDRVNLSFQERKLQSIIGPNGAGKTTLFNLITGMFPPNSGQIFFKGEDITHLPSADIFRRRIVRTFHMLPARFDTNLTLRLQPFRMRFIVSSKLFIFEFLI